MTDAKPATDMPTLETVVKSWREAPYKPATDNQIEAVRARLKIEEEYEMPSWRGNSVAILIARIDTERAARLAAEARVRKLEDALRAVDAELANGFTVCDRCANEEGLSDLDCRETIRAALKEPANG